MDTHRQPEAAQLPIDEAVPLRATKVIYFQQGSEFSSSATLVDVTESFSNLNQLVATGSSSQTIKTAKAAAATGPAMLTLKRPSKLSSHRVVTDAADDLVAELEGRVLAFGRWTVSFPAGSPHSDHAIPLRPVGITTRADEFVKDSVPHFWDTLDGRKLCKLYKVVDGKRREVARFLGLHVRSRDGVLLVDGSQVDEIVACLTCVATLNSLASFRA